MCKKIQKHTILLLGKGTQKRKERKDETKKNANSILSPREKKNCLKSVLFLSKRLIRKETLVATTTDKTPPGRGFVLSRFLFAASREVKTPRVFLVVVFLKCERESI